MQVMALEGGIKGWVKAGPDYTQLMDGYKEEYWRDLLAKESKATEASVNLDAAKSPNPN